MADPYQNPVTLPLGPAVPSGTLVTVDGMTKPYTRVAPIVRNLVADNEGYFAEEIFNMPGMTVSGGAVLFEQSFPDDHFIDPDTPIAPRAAGAEAVKVGSKRKGLTRALVESWAASFDVTDEARRRNDVATVQMHMRKVANSFADLLQSRAMTVLDNFVTAAGREVTGTNWRAAHANGVIDTDPLGLPGADFALVMQTFAEDKTGVRPDLLILNPADAFYLDVIYGEKLAALLSRYGLRLRTTPHQTEGEAIFVKSKQVGSIMFEKPLDTEVTRHGNRKTDEYTMEATPVFVAQDASAILRVTDIDS